MTVLLEETLSKEDSKEKADKLIELSIFYFSIDTDTALYCCDEVLRLGKELQYPKAVAEAYYRRSVIESWLGNFNDALKDGFYALSIADSIKDSILLIKANYNLGNLRKASSLISVAQDNYNTALKISLSLKDTVKLIAIYNGIGTFYQQTSLYDSAAVYLNNALILSEAITNVKDPQRHHENQGKILNNLGAVYYKLQNFDIAYSYIYRALDIAKMYSKTQEEANIYSRLGSMALDLSEYEKADSLYTLADSLYREIENLSGIANMYTNFAYLYHKTGKIEESLKNFNIALQYYREHDVSEGMLAVWGGIADVLVSQDNISKAIQYYDSCVYLAEKTNDLERLTLVLDDLYTISEKNQDYKNALAYLIRLESIEDSIYNLQKEKLTYELYLADEIKKKEFEKSIRVEEKYIQNRLRNRFLYSGLGFILLAVYLLIFFRYRARKNQIIAEQKIQQLEEEKKLMAARFLVEGQENERKRIASAIHDSLGVLLSTSKMHITAIKDDNPENRALIEKATRFLDEANTEMRKISHNMMPGALSKLGLCEALEDLFDTLDETEGIDARMEVLGPKERLPENQEIMIYRVVQEMVNNSLKHSKADRIDLTLVIHPDELDLSYSDNGKGFDMGEVMAKKTMGIQSIRSRVKFMDGIINIDASPGKGVVYRISVPVDANKGLTSV